MEESVKKRDIVIIVVISIVKIVEFKNQDIPALRE